jgi:glycosyltransferase involved in cell wall biosynthesis
MRTDDNTSIAAVVPAYRVAERILDVLAAIGPEVTKIYVVDDACPQRSGARVESECRDARVRVLRHTTNQGVGAATMTGYRAAITDGADIIVKVDGDGQMPVDRISALVAPLLRGDADYVKGNRFYDLGSLREMPRVRLLGNAGLSFLNKLSSGYWNLFDPTNGFTAIYARVAAALPLEQVSRRYFFESDMLFHLNIVRAVVREIPMDARYGDEESNLRVSSALGEFALKHAGNTLKRIFYNYFLRNFSIASVELVAGLVLALFGTYVGALGWSRSIATGHPATSGTVMLAALPIVVGVQFLTAFFAYDTQDIPRTPIHREVTRDARRR